MTSGESSHEDIDASVVGLIFFEVSVDDLERVIVGESDLTNVVEGVGDQGKELMRCVDSFSGGFVKIFTELAPEAVQHEFGCGLASRVFDNEVGIEVDTFSLLVLPDVLSFVCGGDSPGRVASRLLFNFKPGVDVLGKESYFTLMGWEVVYFVDLE